MSDMINPHLLQPMYKPWRGSRWDHKEYIPVLSGAGYTRATHRTFKRATEAKDYAIRIQSRWVRLYDAAIVAMVVPVPAE